MAELQAYDGVPTRIVDGHIHTDPNIPEAKQPALLGFALNPRVGAFGPTQTPCVMVDTHIRRDKLAIARDRPFRSAEYYPSTKTIRGLALLVRDPYLDMGIVTYAGEATYFYSGENFMSDTTKPQSADMELYAKLDAAEKRIADLMEERERNTCLRLIQQLKAERYMLDEEIEVSNLLPRTAAERERHLAYIRRTHAQLPGNDRIEVYSGPSEGGTSRPTSADDMKRAVTVATKRQCSYDEAIELVRTNKA